MVGLVLTRPSPPKITFDYTTVRGPEITTALGTAPADAVLLAGNSHAEIAGENPLGCARWLNAGVGGATARSYAAMLDRITAPARLRLGVLVIGTNDILRRDQPLSETARAAFRADTGRILTWLQARAAGVVVAAVPPVNTTTHKFDTAAIADYSSILEGLCRQEPRCRFADPFVTVRDGASGYARPGAMRDKVHLADYPAMLAALALCPAGEASAAPISER